MNTVGRYLDDVLHRRPMSPDGFEPDWADHPWQHKVYSGVDQVALPEPWTPPGSVDDVLFGAEPDGKGEWSIGLLSSLLFHSYGLLGRRTRITANPAQDGQIPYAGSVWARGSAAGGGLYPCEIYWVRGLDSPGLPGIYHYSAPHHAMNRIAVGDQTNRVRSAIEVPDEGDGGYLLVTVKLWKNSFKYADFSYHCVMMDVGCLLATWHAMASAAGVRLRPRTWFAEGALDRMLGLDPLAESVFAVVALPGTRPVADPAPAPFVRASEVERSKRVIRWPRVEKVHQIVLAEERIPPARALDVAAVPERPTADGDHVLPAPAHERLRTAAATALKSRKSSFGRLSARPSLNTVNFATLLAATAAWPAVHPELRSAGVRTTRVVTIAQHVDSVPRGIYDYLPADHCLGPLPDGDDITQLQQYYALSNYNLEQAAALVAIVARPHRFLEASGAKGYRLLNAEVGAVAQNLYLTAAALGVGCGAVLGFDNPSLAPRLGLAKTDQWPMLLVMLGQERSREADLCSAMSWQESVLGRDI